jgi:hypothetical protein
MRLLGLIIHAPGFKDWMGANARKVEPPALDKDAWGDGTVPTARWPLSFTMPRASAPFKNSPSSLGSARVKGMWTMTT